MNLNASIAFLLLASLCSTLTAVVQGEDELPKFEIGDLSHPVLEGDDVNISCAFSGPSDILLIWQKLGRKRDHLLFVGSQRLTLNNNYELNGDIMTIKNVMRNNSGQYRCYFEIDPIVEVTHTLDIQYAPSISSKIHKNYTVVKGNSVTLKCDTKGNPSPNITWSRVRGDLPVGYEKAVEDGSMTLLNVDRHAEGTYTCKADNGIGAPVTENITIVVEYAPEITHKSIVQATGDKIELVCTVYSNPAAAVTWEKDGSPVDQANVLEGSEEGGHNHTLILENITEDTYPFGDYTCHAKNNHGATQATINVTAILVSTDPPSDTTTTTSKTTTVITTTTNMPQDHTPASGGISLLGPSTSMVVIVVALLLNHWK